MSAALHRVIRCVQDVFKNKGTEAPTLTADTALTPELGLDSLDYAELVVRLEGEFGFDPFASGAGSEIRTMADLASLYEQSRSLS